MRKQIVLSLASLLLCFGAHSQSSLPSVLSSIERNNKDIQAAAQWSVAQQAAYKTGLNPENPVLDYDYMIGAPVGAGNQTDFSVTQAFDFPTVYGRKRQLAERQIAQLETNLQATRMDVLLEAKQACVELVYQNKRKEFLQRRLAAVKKLHDDFETKLEKGSGNILDLNKAKLQLIEVNKLSQENGSRIRQLEQKLTELNGGSIVTLSDTIYPPLPTLPDFEKLEAETEEKDPHRRFLELEKGVNETEVELAKAMALSKLETGYRYQAILGQRFQGFHVGVSLPLWENKHTVEAKREQLSYTVLNMESHRTEHYHQVKRLYDRFVQLRAILSEYRLAMGSIDAEALLGKSLALGQITVIEYFWEMNYYQQALETYLQTEWEYHQVAAELFKYQL